MKNAKNNHDSSYDVWERVKFEIYVTLESNRVVSMKKTPFL